MNYWVVIDRRKMGPLTLEEARRLPLEENSYVWHRGLPSWVKAGELEEFADLFRQPVEVSAENGVNGEITENSVEPVSDNPDSAGEDDSSRDQARPMPFPPPPPAGRFPDAPYGSRPALPEKPPTYLGWSVASIICCCLITGIISVIYAAKVTPLYDMGRYEEARRASEKAELWLIVSITVGIVALPFQFLMAMF